MIPPGQSEQFTLTVPTTSAQADINKKITVTTNDRSNPSLTVECAAKLLVPFRVDPRTVNFGQIARNSAEQRKTVVLTRGDGGPLDPKVTNTGNPNVTAELRAIEPGEKYELEIVARPPWPNGYLRGNVVLDTGIEQAARDTISVMGSVTPRLAAEPARLQIAANPPAPVELQAKLRWDGEPGKVTEVIASDPSLTAELREVGGEQTVVVQVPAHYAPAARTGNVIRVKTDDPAVADFTIPIFAASRTAQPGPARARGGQPAAQPAAGPAPTQVGQNANQQARPTAGPKPVAAPDAAPPGTATRPPT